METHFTHLLTVSENAFSSQTTTTSTALHKITTVEEIAELIEK